MSTNTKIKERDKHVKNILKELKRLKKRKIPKIPASITRYHKRFLKELNSRLPKDKFVKIHIGTKNVLNGKVLNYYSEKDLDKSFCHALTGSYTKCRNKITYICFNMNEKGKKKQDKRKKLVPLCKLHSTYYNKHKKLPKGFYFECEKEKIMSKLFNGTLKRPKKS